MEWNYDDLIKIYTHMIKYKNDQANKHFLDKMQLKAKGYSSFKIAFKKNIN